MNKTMLIALIFVASNSMANGMMLSANDVQTINIAKEKVLTAQEVVETEQDIIEIDDKDSKDGAPSEGNADTKD
ncbi:MAG: hypothetical protein COB89_07540 [Piscirickettsiaceae bacterium]|nr:MAG: hypothetical protein COB89_07540 [Piscirickettsiaceae bacterium]